MLYFVLLLIFRLLYFVLISFIDFNGFFFKLNFIIIIFSSSGTDVKIFEKHFATKIKNINKIQSLTSKSFCRVLNAPTYVSNEKIHNELHLSTVKQTAIFYL